MHDFSGTGHGMPMLALNSGFPFRILSRSFGENKIRNAKPGFEAIPMLYASTLSPCECILDNYIHDLWFCSKIDYRYSYVNYRKCINNMELGGMYFQGCYFHICE